MTTRYGRLAINGGKPAKHKPMPPMYPGGMAMGKEEEQAVIEVIRNKRLFRYYGPKNGLSKTAEFEKSFAKNFGVKYVRAVSSGTAALICALVGAGVGPGDEVIVPAFTWISTASAAIMLGAIPVIAEIDSSLTFDPNDVCRKVTKLTRAILPVHMCGAPADMDSIMAIARKYKLTVIEDAAQAIGGSYHGAYLGSIGDLGTFSLQFNKIITTGEGGLVVTNNRNKWLRVSTYHDPISISMGRDIDIKIAPHFVGQNYRASEFIGTLGLVQLGRLNTLIAAMRSRKRKILAGLQGISGLEFRHLHDIKGDTATSVVFFLPTVNKAKKFSAALTAENVRSRNLYSPEKLDYHVYAHWHQILNKTSATAANFPWSHKYYKGKVNYSRNMCPQTLDILSRAVLFDISPSLTTKEVEEIIFAVKKVANAIL